MASAISPRSPILSTALISPLEYLPVTRFPVDDRTDAFQKLAVEKEKEREVIQSQPYRTTPLICPTPKAKPDFVDNKLSGKKPTSFRPLDARNLNIVGNLNQNQAVVHRQFNSPRPLYSQQNVAEAVYVQTGYNVGQPQSPQVAVTPPQPQMQKVAPAPQRPQPRPQPRPVPRAPPTQAVNHPTTPPVHMVPDSLPEFNPQKSPTFRAIIEEEGLGILKPAPNTQIAPAQIQHQPHQHHHQQPRLPYAHTTAPTGVLNSVGMPNDRIAQSFTFKRLMLSLTE